MIQLIVSTLSNAAVYGLVAVSLSLVYRTSNVLNFGAGFVVAFCGVVSTQTFSNPIVALVASIVLGAVVSMAMFGVAVWPASKLGATATSTSLSVLGFGLVLIYISGRLFGSTSFSNDPWIAGGFRLAGTYISYQRIAMVVVAVVITAALIAFIHGTVVGRAMQALAFDPDLAAMHGVRSTATQLLSWLLAGVCLGVAGSMQVSVASVSESIALPITISALVAAVIGGLGGLFGAALGALIVSLLQSVLITYVTSNFSVSAVFLLLFVVLSVRPQGLLRRGSEGQRV